MPQFQNSVFYSYHKTMVKINHLFYNPKELSYMVLLYYDILKFSFGWLFKVNDLISFYFVLKLNFKNFQKQNICRASYF